jgi:GDPmannose 4,6-dehydratase
VLSDPLYYRPSEIYDLVADPSKARGKLGWKNTYRFEDLVREMVKSDLQHLSGRELEI